MIDSDENEKTKKRSKKKIIKKDGNGKESDSEEQEEKEEIQKAKKKYDKISIYLSGEEFNEKKLDLYLSLSDLRELLDDDIEKNSVFIDKEGNSINLDDEENLSISLILNSKKLKIETKPKIKKKKKEKDTKEKAESISKTKEEAESADKLETKDNINNTDNNEDTPIEKEKKSINGDKKKEKEKENIEEEEDKKKKKSKKKKNEPSDEEYSEEENKKKKKESNSEEYSDGEDKKKKKGADEINGSSKFTPVKKNNTPLPDCELIEKIGELDIYLYNSPNLTDEEMSQAIILMVVGETGTGKTTLLNCYLNYLLGVEISDKFRYKIIYENPSKFIGNEKCQTSEVTIYKIRRSVGKPIIIVDTPGFGDTYEIKNDMNTVAKIKDCLTNKISTINAVCFATKASTNRLTSSQKYVFDSVLNLFGKDIKENIVIMCTFCDGGEPQIVEALQSDESIFKDIINYLEKDEWYYKFSNSAFFNPKIDEYTKMFWKIGMMSYEKFTRKIEKLPAKSLSLTRQVLDERAKLETSVSNLTLQHDNSLNIMNNFKNTIKQIEKLKGDLKNSKDFEFEVDEFYIETIDLSGKGIYTTTCLKCNFTCHNDCSYSDDSDKKKCEVFKSDYCVKCPGKCHWTQHKNLPYIIEKKKRRVKKTLVNLKNAYYEAESKLNLKQQILNGLEKDFNAQKYKCMSLQNQIQISVERLKEIALNKTTYENTYQYIDQLIESEKMQKKPGYLERIKALHELRKKYEMISNLFKRHENKAMKDLNQFTKEFIDNANQQNKGTLDSMNEKKDCLIF